MKINRFEQNPLLTPDDVKPLIPGCKVIGVFNAAVAAYQDETILVLRVAEQAEYKENELKVPVYDLKAKQVIVKDLNPDDYDLSDPRVVGTKRDFGRFDYLTSMSYLRLARSTDGRHFTVEDKPFVFPETEYETFGVEDPRCSKIGDTYYLNFTAVSEHGCATELVSTQDFEHVTREGIIFAPDNKDVTIFEGKANGSYWALNRPTVDSTGKMDVWLASSPDMHNWGNQHYLFGGSEDGWDNGRAGGGMPPFLTEDGWLEIYHSANKQNVYGLGALLLDRNDPTKILARTSEAIMLPQADYEKQGFFGDVVFTCGGLIDGNKLTVYYGASDSVIAGAEFSVSEILATLNN